jgi:hypothetical protein
MVFRAGLRDPCTRDVTRLSESVKILAECLFTLSESRAFLVHLFKCIINNDVNILIRVSCSTRNTRNV